MSTPTTVYIPVPVSEKPKEDGYYHIIDQADGELGDAYYYLDGEWYSSEEEAREDENPDAIDLGGYSWLKPVQLSSDSPIQKAIEFFANKGLDSVIDKLREHLPEDLYRSARIQQLEMQVDHLEEGCNERDKEILQLSQELSNYKHLNAD